MPLHPDKRLPHQHRIAQLRHGVVDGAVFQFEQRGEFVGVELVYALSHVLVEHKVQERLLNLAVGPFWGRSSRPAKGLVQELKHSFAL
jgi:hypothetical protein